MIGRIAAGHAVQASAAAGVALAGQSMFSTPYWWLWAIWGALTGVAVTTAVDELEG